MKRRTVSVAAGVILLAGLLAAGVVRFFQRAVDEPFRGYESGEQFVQIPAGAGLPIIAARLVEAGIVRDGWRFRLAARWIGGDRQLQAGEYRFDRPLSAIEVAGKLVRGDVYLEPITFPEGLSIGEMATIFERHGFGAAETFLRASRQVDLVATLDPAAGDLEGYLFPDTYALPRKAPAELLVRRMVHRFEDVFDEGLRREAAARGLDIREAVTLASLVEEEAARDEERPLVAAVYVNRLRRGMALQCDPTLIYALQRAGRYKGNIRREHLAFDSPYNTYRYPGLPPGPIAAPGRASLEAAVRPAAVNYLYFVSRNDGSHVFASSLAEHNRNVQKYQVGYFREKRLRERRGPTGNGRSEKP